MHFVVGLPWLFDVPCNSLNSSSHVESFAEFGPGFNLILGLVRPLPTIRLVVSLCVITAPSAGGAVGLNCSTECPPRFRQHRDLREQPVGADQNTNNGQEAQKAQVRKTWI